MYLGSWKIDDYLTFACNTHTPSTGAATDADSVPTYRVYEDETATPILTGSMAKLDDVNTTGYYSEQIQLIAANGFEKGKSYTLYISATIGAVTGTMSHTFQMEAEVDANVVSDKADFGLADDAITAAKYDESTAFPLGAVDTGATQVARVGADGDTLEVLSDQLDTAQADLATPEQYKADVSTMALETTLTAMQGAGWTVETLKAIYDAIGALGDATAAEVWAYATRTLTQAAAAVTAAVEGSTLSIRRGDTYDLSLTGLGSIFTRDKLWFTVKVNRSDQDHAALILVEETLGLVYSNGAVAAVAGNGVITIDDAADGDITIKIDEVETAKLTPQNNIYYDVQARYTDGDVHTLTSGTCHIVADVTRRVDE